MTCGEGTAEPSAWTRYYWRLSACSCGFDCGTSCTHARLYWLPDSYACTGAPVNRLKQWSVLLILEHPATMHSDILGKIKVKYSHYRGFNGTPQVLAAPLSRPVRIPRGCKQHTSIGSTFLGNTVYCREHCKNWVSHSKYIRQRQPGKAQSLTHVKNPRLTVSDYEYKYSNISRASFTRKIYLSCLHHAPANFANFLVRITFPPILHSSDHFFRLCHLESMDTL